MAKVKSPITIKNEIRTTTFETMQIALGKAYGANNIYRIGDTEIAVKVAEAPTGEPIYATFSPTIKDYCDRQTKTKVIKAFDLTAEVAAYEKTLTERKAKAEESAERKTKKIESDKAKREATAKAKAEHAKRKADTLTAFKMQAANNVEVTYRPQTPKEG